MHSMPSASPSNSRFLSSTSTGTTPGGRTRRDRVGSCVCKWCVCVCACVCVCVRVRVCVCVCLRVRGQAEKMAGGAPGKQESGEADSAASAPGRTEEGQRGAAGLLLPRVGQRRDHVSARLRLPPGVDDGAAAVAHDVVVPWGWVGGWRFGGQGGGWGREREVGDCRVRWPAAGVGWTQPKGKFQGPGSQQTEQAERRAAGGPPCEGAQAGTMAPGRALGDARARTSARPLG
jgi:hypothetical protein